MVSALFPPPRSHKTYFRHASLQTPLTGNGVEPIYYDNVPVSKEQCASFLPPPLPPPRKQQQHNVVSYVEVFGQESLTEEEKGLLPVAAPVRPGDHPRTPVLTKQLSFDSAITGTRNNGRNSMPVSPELRRYCSQQNTFSEHDMSEELCKFIYCQLYIHFCERKKFFFKKYNKI